MKKFLLLVVFLPAIVLAHPGVGIVADNKGNIYFTDLKHVWKITDGLKKIVVPDVHTHELYIDENDNLFGENEMYESATGKFYHYSWVYHPDGNIDTVDSIKQAYINQNYALARDWHGNQYYIKQFLAHPDTIHIYKKNLAGEESVFATGNFKGVKWLHPQKDGSLLYNLENNIYRVDKSGNIKVIKQNIASKTPAFDFSGTNITVWGIWQDESQQVYVAVFSDQQVKKIDLAGKVTTYYQSKGNWTPLHGVFDNQNRLWVLEGSNKNEVRVILASTNQLTETGKTEGYFMRYYGIGFILLIALMAYLLVRYYNTRKRVNGPTG